MSDGEGEKKRGRKRGSTREREEYAERMSKDQHITKMDNAYSIDCSATMQISTK